MQPLLLRPSTVALALVVSLSANVGLAAWIGASTGSQDLRATWVHGSQRPVESR